MASKAFRVVPLFLISASMIACNGDSQSGHPRPSAPQATKGGTDRAKGAAANSEKEPTEVVEEPPPSVVNDATFELKASAGEPTGVGDLAQFTVTLTPKGKYHVNEEFPLEIDFEAPEAIKLVKATLTKTDAAMFGEDKARFDVPFSGDKPGEHFVAATVRFAVCTPQSCVPDEKRIGVTVSVAKAGDGHKGETEKDKAGN